jgi:CRP-like cAMP-binding protein
VASHLRAEFGKLMDVREVKRVRRVAGEAWMATVVMHTPAGDLHAADITVDDTGKLTPELDGGTVVAAVKRATNAQASLAPEQDFDDMGALPDELADFAAAEDPLAALDATDPIEVRIDVAMARGDAASLTEARELLPRLLADHEKRGETLLKMAEVEIGLGEEALARGYLEAAAREFADRFTMPLLEVTADLTLSIVGKDAFTSSPVYMLLEDCRARLRPMHSLQTARSFQGLEDGVLADLLPHITLRTLAAGEVLVTEGAPSESVFVVKSGLLGVWLEKPSGGQWLVRCCFPGWLLGESSALSYDNPRCTATLKAERFSEVWSIPAAPVREAMQKYPAFAKRIAETKQLHRIDSFFSMHETMGHLDVQVRDEMLSCIERLESFAQDTQILAPGDAPQRAYLVARGEILLLEPGKPEPVGRIAADAFFGVRDTVHQIAPGLEARAAAGTTLACFNGDRLRKLCLDSPEHVVAVLERLG